MLERLFCEKMKRWGLDGKRVGVAVSGGKDSMVLLELADIWGTEVSTDLVVLHFDHGTRAESSQDADFVRNEAARRGRRFLLGKRAEPLPRRNIEERLRKERYGWFEKTAEEERLAGILLAHTADDQAETILWNLFRGAGRRGAGGMRSHLVRGRANFYRPLLEARRAEIVRFANERGIPWREDSTNKDTAFLRNRIRREIMPFLEERLGRDITGPLCRFGKAAAEEDAFLDDLVAVIPLYRKGKEIWCERKKIDDLAPVLRTRLFRRILRELGIGAGAEETNSLWKAYEDRCERILEGGGRVLGNGSFLILGDLAAKRKFSEQVRIDPGKEIRLPALDVKVLLDRDPYDETSKRSRVSSDEFSSVSRIHLNRACLSFPLFLRTRRPGDRIRPLGAPGTTKLKKIMIEKGIPRFLRQNWPVICDQKGILWIPGLCQAERTRVLPETKETATLEIAWGEKSVWRPWLFRRKEEE
ncbi:MAG: tRNA lysidine(34) synthetase TilS [Candidatus Hydrogenedentota bacterium]|nr:MAG: tRNA lysidine(34) synthetase TilS [Candidatus Hydrogenedentota bacterium]